MALNNLEKRCENLRLAGITITISLPIAGYCIDKYKLKGNGVLGLTAGCIVKGIIDTCYLKFVDKYEEKLQSDNKSKQSGTKYI